MPPMHVVRAMQAEEVPIVARWLITLPLMQRYHLTEASAQRMFEQGFSRGDHLMVVDSGKATACGFAWVMPQGAFDRSAYLRLIGVRPDLSSQGIGSLLLDEAEQFAFDAGRDFFLLVSDFNVQAQHFYRRHGFRQIGAIPGYVLPDVTEYIYWKPYLTS
jgi:ribosomal protein S18 acetylase RimI-like enzyme